MQHFDIQDLIPQRKPFMMVDQLIDFQSDQFESTFQIQDDNYFSENGLFQAEGIIENMAQTAAAGAGYGFKMDNKSIKLGFIGALKNMVIHSLPKVNTQIRTRIKIVSRVWNVDIAEGQVFDENEQLLASGEMKIFINEDSES